MKDFFQIRGKLWSMKLFFIILFLDMLKGAKEKFSDLLFWEDSNGKCTYDHFYNDIMKSAGYF